MAEVQTNTQSGELAQRFIEFVMMHAQNAALFLGQIPNPQTGQGEVNLELAKMFIDQLAMIQEKTRGNLSQEEANVLRNAIANLQMAFVEISQEQKSGGSGASRPIESAPAPAAAPPPPKETPATEPVAGSEAGAPAAAEESESKKKFTKSYGS